MAGFVSVAVLNAAALEVSLCVPSATLCEIVLFKIQIYDFIMLLLLDKLCMLFLHIVVTEPHKFEFLRSLHASLLFNVVR